MDLKGKRLLILGGASVHCKVVEAAKRLGVYTIVADYLTDSPAKKIADESLLISILDVDAIVDWCKKNPVDGVINYANDPAQKVHQQICETLDFPCYGTAEQVAALTDKRLFKQACVAGGASVIPSYTEKQILDSDPAVKYPLLIKPSDSRGSRGQTICQNREEALEGISFAKSESFTGNAVIERHMGGHNDMQLVYLVENGVPALVKVEDRYLGSKENGLDRLCVTTICPSVHEAEYREKLNSKVAGMIRHMGIENGPIFLQGFWDDGDVLFYDPGIRLPGDGFDYAYTKATGICLPEILVQYALTGKIVEGTAAAINAARIRMATAMVLPCVRPGKIASVTGLDKLKENSAILDMSVEYGAGDEVGEHGNVKQRFSEFVFCCDNFREMKKTVADVFETLSVTDEQGSNMLIECFDVNGFDKYIEEYA